MKHSIAPIETGLRIHADVDESEQESLLRELQKCASGNCSCPSPQYEKLESIDIKTGPEGIAVDLKVKAGEVVDVADIEKCLEHTSRIIEG